MLILSVLLSLLTLLRSADAQVPFLGPCNPVSTVENFTISRYLGRWYEAERYFNIMEFAGKCVHNNITDTSNDNNTQLLIVTRQTSWLTDINSSIKGQMRPTDQRGDMAKMIVRYLPMDFSVNHWILDTDYDNYAVVYSCADIGSVLSSRNAWILTRDRAPALDVMEKAYAVIDRNNISRAFFIRVDQSDRSCPEYKVHQ